MVGNGGAATGRLSWRFHALAIGLLSGIAWLGMSMATDPLVETGPARSGPASDREPGKSTAALSERNSNRGAAVFQQSIERPLFVAGRRPPPSPDTREDAAGAPNGTGLSLVGVMQDGSGPPRALIRWPDQPSTWVGVGEQVRGWRISTIDGTRVVIEGTGGRQELSLYRPR